MKKALSGSMLGFVVDILRILIGILLGYGIPSTYVNMIFFSP